MALMIIIAGVTTTMIYVYYWSDHDRTEVNRKWLLFQYWCHLKKDPLLHWLYFSILFTVNFIILLHYNIDIWSLQSLWVKESLRFTICWCLDSPFCHAYRLLSGMVNFSSRMTNYYLMTCCRIQIITYICLIIKY